MDLEHINFLLRDEKPFRSKQVEEAIYKNHIRSWSEATALPALLRHKLEEEIPLVFKCETIKSFSSDSVKAVLGLNDGLKVETVLLRHGGTKVRNTVCVSSQAGCRMNCIFCRTAKIPFKRNLSFNEIVEQVLFFVYYLSDFSQKVTNVVFMGMGEPLLNYENVIQAIRIINDKQKLNIGSRKISISTCGIPDMIEKLAEEKFQLNLAISLNAPENNLRSQLMPVNEKYPLKKLFQSISKYLDKTGRRVMFEYVLLKGINDDTLTAEELCRLLKKELPNGGLYFVNLIPFNGTGKLVAPGAKTIKEFKNILEREGISVTQRYRFGDDISGACGQLLYQFSE
jgi:23S rRNA (adenine2503-C2)-methyltransferase